MDTPFDSIKFLIDRGAVERYFFTSHTLNIFLGGLFLFGVGILLAPLYAFTLGPWLTRMQANELKYWLDGTTLRVDQGSSSSNVKRSRWTGSPTSSWCKAPSCDGTASGASRCRPPERATLSPKRSFTASPTPSKSAINSSPPATLPSRHATRSNQINLTQKGGPA